MTKGFRDTLYSRGFLRQVGNIALFFAALNGVAGVIAVAFAAGHLESIAAGIGMLFVGAALCVMGLLVRRGWRSVFWLLVGLFGVDALMMFFVPSGRAFGGALVARTFVIVALVKDFQRRRHTTDVGGRIATSRDDTV